LTTLDGYLEGLEDGVIHPGAPTWQLLRTETGRLTRLVNDLAELWRAEAQQLELHPRLIDVAEVARQVQARFTPLAAGRSVAVEVEGTSVIAATDPDRLAQVLSSFVSNAVRHAPDGTSVRLITARAGNRALVSVVDQGPGLAPSQLEAVFERFYRVDAARSRAAGGSGIGLAIARAVADAMGGRAWAESDGHGLGARFMIEFPIE
jgi:signal transduction histidine kinase